MLQPTTIGELIATTHEYLAGQQEAAAPERFSLMQASQCRSLKLQLESWVGGCTKDAATMHLASIRDGPWRPIHINQFSEAFDVAAHHASSPKLPDRKPQHCDNPENFWTDELWDITLDKSATRIKRLGAVAEFLMSIGLTNPDPATKQRIVSMLALGDEWIASDPANAKVVYGELGTALDRVRPPRAAMSRPHLRDFPNTPSDACAAIDGFADRVYGESGHASNSPPKTAADIDKIQRDHALRWTKKSVRDAAPATAATVRRATTVPPLELNMQQSSGAGRSIPKIQFAQDMQLPQGMQGMQGMMQLAMMASQMSMLQMMNGDGMQMMGGGGMQGAGNAGAHGMGMGGMGGMQCGMGGFAGGGCGATGGGYHQGARGAMNALTAHRGRGPRAATATQDGAEGAGGANMNDRPEEEQSEDGALPEGPADELETLEAALCMKRPASAGPRAMKAMKAMKAAGEAVRKHHNQHHNGEPHWGPEDSRGQIMCRTGLPGPNQSMAIKYAAVGGKAAAIKFAEKWVADQKRKKSMAKKPAIAKTPVIAKAAGKAAAKKAAAAKAKGKANTKGKK